MRNYKLLTFQEFTLKFSSLAEERGARFIYVTDTNELSLHRVEIAENGAVSRHRELANLIYFDPEHPQFKLLYCDYLVFCTLC